MSRFLRNVVVAAQDPGASLQPRVPSRYAELGDRSEPAPLMSDEFASPHDVAAPPSTRDDPRQPHLGRAASIEQARDPDRESKEAAPRWSPLMEGALDERIPVRHSTASPQHSAQRALDAPTHAASLLNAATAWASTHRPRTTQKTHEPSTPAADSRASPIGGAVRPRLHEPKSESLQAPRAHHGPASPTRRQAPLETRGSRTDGGRSGSSSNDVEIHIGRIEVIAGTPTQRAPPKAAHKSPSLGDYLNGRRRSRP